MTLNKAPQDNIAQRREAVASLRLRGLSLREIVISLAKQNPPILNAKNEPYSYVTIKNDLDAAKYHISSPASLFNRMG